MKRQITGALLASLFVACSSPVSPPQSAQRALALSADEARATTCASNPAVVASNQAELLAALAAASPGDVIAIAGTIVLTVPIELNVPDVTLTCATRGAGLVAVAPAGDAPMLSVRANGVVIAALVLDGRDTGPVNGYPVFASGDDVQLINSEVLCGPTACAFFAGAERAVIRNNYFESAGSLTGLHLQRALSGPGSMNGTRIEFNRVVATAPSTSPAFGGIRPRDGVDVVIAHNEVRGPWANGMSLAGVSSSLIEANALDGAWRFGIQITTGGQSPVRDNVLRANRTSAAALAGLFVREACRNLFLGNNLDAAAGAPGAMFAASTGANTLLGNHTVVQDAGARDCDGDGSPDPNVITGATPGPLSISVAEPIVAANQLR